MTENRKRAANFSCEECLLLINIIKKYKDVIECRQTGKTSVDAKMKKWKEIEKEFNSESIGCFRSVDVLRKKYDNIKKDTKKKISEEKREMYVTGGGPSQPTRREEADNVVLEVLGDKVKGLESWYDSDVVNGKQTPPKKLEENNIDIDLLEETQSFPQGTEEALREPDASTADGKSKIDTNFCGVLF